VLAALSLTACTGAGSSSPAPDVSTPVDEASPSVSPEAVAAAPADGSEPLRLVTLGDAYTAGTDTPAPKVDSWPAQLSQAMDRGDVRLRLVANLADSGQTSEDVIRAQLRQLESWRPDVVTLQVGVNDIIARDISLADYRQNMAAILDELLSILPAARLFVITTPDHTLTARGGDYTSREAGSAAVLEANGILTDEAGERGITVIDISRVNGLAEGDASLVIGEGPYPSAKQYAGWVEVIGPQIGRALSGLEP